MTVLSRPLPVYVSGILLLAAALSGHAQPSDTALAAYPRDTIVIIRPASGSVVTTNSLVLEARAHAAPGDSVIAMEFRAGYVSAGYDSTSNEGFHQIVFDKMLHVDSTAPYQWIWDVRGIQDHYQTRMVISFIAHTAKGRIFSRNTADFALDRNPEVNHRQVLHCKGLRETGVATWDTALVTRHFKNADNTIRFGSWWTPDSLYFLFSVKDNAVVPAPLDLAMLDSGGRQARWWYGDDIEIFIDARRSASPLMDTAEQYQVVLHPDGFGYMGRISLLDTVRYKLPARARRTPHGYDISCAIAWAWLKVKPAAGMRLGVEVANIDLDTRDGLYAMGTWMGLTMANHHNASEWGELALEPPSRRIAVAAAAIAAVILGGAAAVLLVRRRRRPVAAGASVENRAVKPIDLNKASTVTRAALEMIAAEYKNEGFNLDFAARQLKRNPKYLSTLFKEDTGMNFTKYLNRVRLEKADSLLRTTEISISDISFEVGYNSFKYFSTVYKAHFGVSPSQAREKR